MQLAIRFFAILLMPILIFADGQFDIRIPVVDMRDLADLDKREQFLDTLYEAMTTVGFFAVTHTGIDDQVIKDAYAASEAFFKQDVAFKAKSFDPVVRGQRGFMRSEVAKGNYAKDFKEFYHIAREGSTPANIWSELPGFKESMVKLFDELEKYVVPLQESIVQTINRHTNANLPLNFLNETTKNGSTLLRPIYYPALTEEQIQNSDELIIWGAAHTDIDYLAILPHATEKGLQVQINGQWSNVVVPEDAFIVNIGDMLENMTNGLFVSARHRVVALEPNKERFSMVLFVHPTYDTPLDPLPACIAKTGGVQRYAPGKHVEFLYERLIELDYEAPGLLEMYAKSGHTERQMQYNRESKQVVEVLIKNGLASQEILDAWASKR